jgi:secretory phospholipase A2
LAATNVESRISKSTEDLVEDDEIDEDDGGRANITWTSYPRRKRSVMGLYHMLQCTSKCNPLGYKGYGCYCGFLGSGTAVDGIDTYV